MKKAIFECPNHGIITPSTGWVRDDKVIICGKCGKPGIPMKGSWGAHEL